MHGVYFYTQSKKYIRKIYKTTSHEESFTDEIIII